MASPPSDRLPDSARRGIEGCAPSPEVAAAALANLTRWLSDRTFQGWHPQLHALIAAERWALLVDCFYRVMPFGTGGRRGPVGIGPNRFNPWTLGTSVQGHAAWLRDREGPGEATVVIGFDVRAFQDLGGTLVPGVAAPIRGIRSRDFALMAAEIYAAAGFLVYIPADGAVLSTPELSFAIRHLGAVAGLQITASHNPPDDNGGKIYGPTGGQLIPPMDQSVADRIAEVDYVDRMSIDRAMAAGLVRTLPDDLHAAYVRAQLRAQAPPQTRGARVVFSPLHGTGLQTVAPVLEAAGFFVAIEPTQRAPDGAFPATPFRCPNPEVPAALDAAVQYAQTIGADLAMACDPDADRLGLSVRARPADPATGEPARWRFITGNELAALVCHQALRHRPPERPRPLVYKTLVTSSLVERVARMHGAEVEGDLLVGFKYIGAAMDALEGDGGLHRFAAGLEESHGVLVSADLRDKDAAGGALALATLASEEKAQGRTLVDTLDQLWTEVGYVANVLRSGVMRGATGRSTMAAIQSSLRQAPPEAVGGRRVVQVIDRLDTRDGAAPLRSETDAKSRDMLVILLEQHARVVLRPSGTEPKVKVYAEVCAAPGEWGSAVRSRVDAEVHALAEDTLLLLLQRVGMQAPRWALAASDLVSIEHKLQLPGILAELQERAGAADAATDPAALQRWLDGRLREMGADARALVAPAVAQWAAEEGTPAAAQLRALFD